jgi:hypothetical protein
VMGLNRGQMGINAHPREVCNGKESIFIDWYTSVLPTCPRKAPLKGYYMENVLGIAIGLRGCDCGMKLFHPGRNYIILHHVMNNWEKSPKPCVCLLSDRWIEKPVPILIYEINPEIWIAEGPTECIFLLMFGFEMENIDWKSTSVKVMIITCL